MARPRTSLGTAGSVKTLGQVNLEGRWVAAPAGTKPTRWRAKTRFRDADGVLREVERFAATKGKAETALKAALVKRSTPTKGEVLRADMSVTDAGEVWLAQVDRPDSNLSDNTRAQYRAAFGRHVVGSSIAGLSLREVNRVPVLRKYLQTVADEHGTGSAKTARSVVSNIIGMAVGDGVLDFNATREVRPAQARITKATQRDTRRALTRDERAHFMATADSHAPTEHLDVSDLAAFMAALGVRISEGLGQRWADVNLEAGTVLVRGTKTSASTRLLHMPSWLTERLRERSKTRGAEGLVFPSPGTNDRDKPRDRRNVARAMRAILDAAGLPWATPHSLRRTVATLLDEAGQPIALAANVLGHADPAMTARVYLGRKGSTSAAAEVL